MIDSTTLTANVEYVAPAAIQEIGRLARDKAYREARAAGQNEDAARAAGRAARDEMKARKDEIVAALTAWAISINEDENWDGPHFVAAGNCQDMPRSFGVGPFARDFFEGRL